MTAPDAIVADLMRRISNAPFMFRWRKLSGFRCGEYPNVEYGYSWSKVFEMDVLVPLGLISCSEFSEVGMRNRPQLIYTRLFVEILRESNSISFLSCRDLITPRLYRNNKNNESFPLSIFSFKSRTFPCAIVPCVPVYFKFVKFERPLLRYERSLNLLICYAIFPRIALMESY